MKKIFLLILTLAFAQGALFAQADGDYRNKLSLIFTTNWNDVTKWETYNGGAWGSAATYPVSPITTTVTIISKAKINIPITIDPTGKIVVKADGTNITTLTVANADSLIVKGALEITSGGYSRLLIELGSKLDIKPGGTVTDFSGGNITNNGDLIIESVSGSTQNGSLITASTVTGTYKQYIPANQWHLIAPPFDVFASDFYDASNVYIRPYLTPSSEWGAYITEPTTSIESKKGYLVWEDADYTFSKSGTFLSGTQNLTFSYGSGDNTKGWNLFGNPYPAGLDWNLIMDLPDADLLDGQTFYVYSQNDEEYLWRNHLGFGTTKSAIIPPFQGFFVRAWVDGNLPLDKSMLAHPDTSLYKSSNAELYSNYIMLEADFNGQKSYALSYQQDIATNGKDNAFDAPKLFSESSSIMGIYSFAGDKQSCINTYGEYPYVMELGFKVPTEDRNTPPNLIDGGEITLTPTDFKNLDPMLSVYLEDIETGAYFDFLANPSYTFAAMGGDVTDRIYLIMNNNVGINAIDKNSIQIFSNKNAVYLGYSDIQFSGELKIYNLLGQTVYQSKVTNNNYKPIYLNQPSAYYIVELITENENITQKVFILQ